METKAAPRTYRIAIHWQNFEGPEGKRKYHIESGVMTLRAGADRAKEINEKFGREVMMKVEGDTYLRLRANGAAY